MKLLKQDTQFDLSTAEPQAPFDVSTARPVEESKESKEPKVVEATKELAGDTRTLATMLTKLGVGTVFPASRGFIASIPEEPAEEKFKKATSPYTLKAGMAVAAAMTGGPAGVVGYLSFLGAYEALDKIPKMSETELGEKIQEEMPDTILAGLGMGNWQAEVPTKFAMDALQEGAKFYAAVKAGGFVKAKFIEAAYGKAPQAAVAEIRDELMKRSNEIRAKISKTVVPEGATPSGNLSEEQATQMAEQLWKEAMRRGGDIPQDLADKITFRAYNMAIKSGWQKALDIVRNQRGELLMPGKEDLPKLREIFQKMKVPPDVAKLAEQGEWKMLPAKVLEVIQKQMPYLFDLSSRPAKAEVDPLTESARKAVAEGRTVDEWVNFMRGSATQYREYNPKLRALYGVTDKATRMSELGVDGEKEITIYRGVPDAKNNTIQDGDFITTDLQSAASYAGKENVVSKKVKAKDLIVDYPDEFSPEQLNGIGYEYIYSDSKNKITALSESDLRTAYDKAKAEAAVKQVRDRTEPSRKKIRGLSKGVEEKAIKNKLTETLGDLPEYETMNMKEQATLAQLLLDTDYGLAKKIAMGQAPPPANLLPESVFVAVENRAIQEGDVELIKKLGTSSALVQEATAMGQRIRTLGERNPDSPVSAIKDLSKYREEIAKTRQGKKFKSVREEVKDVKESIKEFHPKKDDWENFIKSLSEDKTSDAYLPKHLADDFMARLKSGDINPERMAEMTSEERNEYLTSFLGEANAFKVNAEFESKLLLKNIQKGMMTWAEKVTGIREPAKRDIVSRINRMERVLTPEEDADFLADLAMRKLKLGVTSEEAREIFDLAKATSEKKEAIPEDSPIGSDERMAYGEALVNFREYINALKLEAKGDTSLIEFIKNPSKWLEGLKDIAGSLKSMKASFDASVLGRQGFVTAVTKPKIFWNAANKMIGDWKTSLKGLDATIPIKADIFSRPNAINGNYRKIGVDIAVSAEEPFPKALGEKIPILGYGYKASREAFEGAMLRMRADWADATIAEYERQGIDLKDSGIGRVINSVTGRGDLILTPKQAESANIIFFSVKYVKSQFDILTAHVFDPKVRKDPIARKTALFNLLRVAGFVAGSLSLAKAFDPESVELDPRSNKFGRIYVGKDHKIGIDITGGLRSMFVFMARMVPTIHREKGEKLSLESIGQWYKTKSGEYVKLGDKSWGSMHYSKVISEYIEGKYSPALRLIKDILAQKTFDGEDVTLGGEFKETVKPISMTNAWKAMHAKDSENLFLKILLAAYSMIGGGVSEEKKYAKAKSKSTGFKPKGSSSASSTKKTSGFKPRGG